MTQAYLSLLDALSDYKAKYTCLDVEHFDTVPEPDLTNALDALWETRRACHSLAAAIRESQPTSDADQAFRREALVLHLVLANLDDPTLVGLSEFSIDTIRTLYPLSMLPILGCRDLPQSPDK